MKKFIITLLCLAIIAGGGYFGYEKFQQSKDEKRIVDVVPVSLLNQDYYNEPKTTEACVTSGSIQNVELSTQKLIKEVCVSLGDKVKKGDTLLVYDMTIVDLENEKNKNNLAVIDQEIKELEKDLKRIQGLQPSENKPKNDSSSKKDEPVTTTTTSKTTTTKKTTTKKASTTAMIRPVSRSETTTTTTKVTKKSTTKKPEPEPVSVRSELTTIENPDGYELDGSINFRCTASTVATADFMQQVIDNGQHVILYVYNDEHRRIQYFWDIDPASNTKLEATEWRLSDGVISNHGSYAYNGPSDLKNGVFYVYIEPDVPDYGGDDEYDDYGDDGYDIGDDGADFGLPDQGGDTDDDDIGELPDITQKPEETDPPEDIPDEPDSSDDKHIDVDLTNDSDDGSDTVIDTDSFSDDTDDSAIDKPEDENYKYTRAELVEKVKEAQIALKEKQLEYRKAELEYNAGLKQKEDGKVVAQIDGVVTRLDEETTSYNVGTDDGYDDFYENDGFEDFEDIADPEDEGGFDSGFGDHPYITVQGQATVSLDINVPELSLSKFPKGTVVSGMNWNTGEEFTAVVTGRKDDPVSYRSYGDDNPNSSTYIVTADVQDCPTLAINQYVVINIPENEGNKKNANTINLPVSYIRKEGASYYVMMEDENGLLKKRYVKTGKKYYGEIIEVLKGLTAEDRICFPYGKDVKEGVKTRETDDIVW